MGAVARASLGPARPGPNPPLGPHQLAWFESALATLARSGLAGNEVLSLALFLLASIRGQAALAVHSARPDATADEIGRALAEVVTADRFPTLSAILAAPAVGHRAAGPGPLPDLEFGLHRLLDGVQAYVSARLGPGPEPARSTSSAGRRP